MLSRIAASSADVQLLPAGDTGPAWMRFWSFAGSAGEKAGDGKTGVGKRLANESGCRPNDLRTRTCRADRSRFRREESGTPSSWFVHPRKINQHSVALPQRA